MKRALFLCLSPFELETCHRAYASARTLSDFTSAHLKLGTMHLSSGMIWGLDHRVGHLV